MLFNSLEFAIFLPIVFFLYWFATNKNLRNQNLLIVAASLLFYGWWDWRFLLLMVVTITLSYLSGLAIRQVRSNREEHSARRGARLVTALN
ncbi:MAG TPA: MBOAT family protein, partial [Proteiniphilum sp.]|nr:MBOAT family protein [Proteiniphilum sp.]